MHVIPVIDLKSGLVVRGIAGRRELYRPIESAALGCEPSPGDVAQAFVRRFGFTSAYVADLDAIAGDEPNWTAYEAIASTGIRLCVDAGIGSIQQASRFIHTLEGCDPYCGVVVGLETLRQPNILRDLAKTLGPGRAIFSLDLRKGQPLTGIAGWSDAEPIDLVDIVVTAGFERLIVLDLASVGVGQGPSVLELCRTIRKRHPQLEIISGGGVRNRSDLVALAATGCNAALVASALHDGRLSAVDLATCK